MSYQLYRNTTLGHTLQESLDELIQVSYYTDKPLQWGSVVGMGGTHGIPRYEISRRGHGTI